MSFGSLVRSSTLPKTTINMFIRAFAQIPQTVVFKYEEDLPDVPNNVILRKWLPQVDMIGNIPTYIFYIYVTQYYSLTN